MALKQKKKCNACKVAQCLENFTEDLKDTCKYCSLKEEHCLLKEKHRREVLRLQKLIRELDKRMESLEEKNDERIMKMDAKVVGVEQSCRILECKVTREVKLAEKPTNVTAINVQDW